MTSKTKPLATWTDCLAAINSGEFKPEAMADLQELVEYLDQQIAEGWDGLGVAPYRLAKARLVTRYDACRREDQELRRDVDEWNACYLPDGYTPVALDA